MAERIWQLECLLAEARSQRDRLETAVRWALGLTDFEPRANNPSFYPPYWFWWQRKIRELAGR
jgi:hypothetical protein